jgi:flagellar basal-body rod modification protein FlgD
MQILANPAAASPFAAPQPTDTSSADSSSDSSDSDSATITANDFLQLLVTEMQNQDPTADTDPNEYIDQLVQVNSLEQLISINQDLSGLSSPSGSAGSNGGTDGVVNGGMADIPATSEVAAGNLSATDTGGRASRIANALGTAAQTLAPASMNTQLSGAIGALRNREQHASTSVSNPAHSTRARN